MSTPVVAVSSAPKFGGLTGYKRPALGKPTQVPSNLPAFRGKPYTPGSDNLKAPPIQNSKNRQDRGTNVTIPYARTCPIDHARDLGRIAPGDVVFTSRYQVDVSHVGHRKEHVVGLDFLNKALGNDDSIKAPAAKINPNWVVGKTVLIGGSNDLANFDSVGGIMADNWREASFLQDWCCDGILLSNDEPYAHTNNGANDVQQFNICVQGVSACNNGFVDYRGHGVEAYPRHETERQGYGKQGTVAIGGTPYYPSYPLQMFDRKVKALSTLYVGLVATKRELTDDIRDALKSTSTHLSSDSLHYQKLHDATGKYESFYTFKFVCFSDRAARQGAFGKKFRDDWRYAEPPGKKQKPVHQNDVAKGSLAFDPYEPVSLAEYRGMVGAWKVGKVLDTAARRKDVYNGGPIDTAEQLTVNVCIEWCDWRVLRRLTNREDIGGYVSGAAMWLSSIPGQTKAKDDKTEMIFYVDKDEGRIFHWPTQYTPRGSSKMDAAKDADAARSNAPMNMDRDATNRYYKLNKDADQQYDDYIQNAKTFFDVIGDDDNYLGVRNRIILARSKGNLTKLSDAETDALFNAIANGENDFNFKEFENWFVSLDPKEPQNLKFLQALLGPDRIKDADDVMRYTDTGNARRLFAQMTYFSDLYMLSLSIKKETLAYFLSPEPKNKEQKEAQSKVPSTIGDSMEQAVNTLIEHEIDMREETGGTGSTGGTVSMDVDAVGSTSSTAPRARGRGSKSKAAVEKAAVPPAAVAAPKAAVGASAAPPASATKAAPESAFPAAVSKPTAKPAAKSVVSTGTTSAVAGAASTTSEQPDIFASIFGSSGSASSHAPTGDVDKSPSSGNPRSRVRRARDGK